MWPVSVKAGQKRTETRPQNAHTHEERNTGRKEQITWPSQLYRLLRITSEYIVTAILDIHTQLSVDRFLEQSYDGAKYISVVVSGVQLVVRQHSPLRSTL